MSTSQKKYVPGRTVAVAFASLALSVFALLLWGKLKLVTGVPRTAYAEPERAAPPPKVPPQAKPVSKPAPKVTPVPASRPDLRGD